MNFLSHDAVLPSGSPSITRVGSCLPDLWPLLPKRVLPLVVLRMLRSHADPRAALLATGIESHMRADAIFHGHGEFQRRVSIATKALRSAVCGARHASLLAHVAVEVILDRWIMDTDEAAVDRYYGAFDVGTVDVVVSLLQTQGDSDSDPLRQVLHRFVGSAFLRDYRSTLGMASRVVRSLTRVMGVDQNWPEESLVPLMDDWRAEFDAGSGQLIADVRAALDHWPRNGSCIGP